MLYAELDTGMADLVGRKFDAAMMVVPKAVRARCQENEAKARAIVVERAKADALDAMNLCINLEQAIRACLDAERLLAYLALPPRADVNPSEQLRCAAAAGDLVGFYGAAAGDRRAWRDPSVRR